MIDKCDGEKKTKLVRAHIKHAARTRSIVVAFGRHILRFSISLWVLVEWESVGAGKAIIYMWCGGTANIEAGMGFRYAPTTHLVGWSEREKKHKHLL